jgi:hypothetical protein
MCFGRFGRWAGSTSRFGCTYRTSRNGCSFKKQFEVMRTKGKLLNFLNLLNHKTDKKQALQLNSREADEQVLD